MSDSGGEGVSLIMDGRDGKISRLRWGDGMMRLTRVGVPVVFLFDLGALLLGEEVLVGNLFKLDHCGGLCLCGCVGERERGVW